MKNVSLKSTNKNVVVIKDIYLKFYYTSSVLNYTQKSTRRHDSTKIIIKLEYVSRNRKKNSQVEEIMEVKHCVRLVLIYLGTQYADIDRIITMLIEY